MSKNERAATIAFLTEIRSRLLVVIAAVVAGAVLCYAARELLLGYLLYPLRAQYPMVDIVYTGVPELFFLFLKLSLYGGMAFAFPLLCWQIWQFLKPALTGKERGLAWPFLLLTPLLFYTGALFCWGVMMPLVIQFFFSFTTADLTALPDIRLYVSFILKLMFAFALAFTLPMALVVIMRLGWVQPATLAKSRRYVIVGIFAMAAFFTPPDPLSQLLLAVPLYVLFEGSLLLGRWV